MGRLNLDQFKLSFISLSRCQVVLESFNLNLINNNQIYVSTSLSCRCGKNRNILQCGFEWLGDGLDGVVVAPGAGLLAHLLRADVLELGQVTVVLLLAAVVPLTTSHHRFRSCNKISESVDWFIKNESDSRTYSTGTSYYISSYCLDSYQAFYK